MILLLATLAAFGDDVPELPGLDGGRMQIYFCKTIDNKEVCVESEK